MVERSLRIALFMAALTGLAGSAVAQNNAAPASVTADSGAILEVQEARLAAAKAAQETQLAKVRERNVEARLAAAEAQARSVERKRAREVPTLQKPCTADANACAGALSLRQIVDREQRVAEQRLDMLSRLQQSLKRRLAGEGPKGGLDRR